MIDRCIIAGMSQACDESQALDRLKCLIVIGKYRPATWVLQSRSNPIRQACYNILSS